MIHPTRIKKLLIANRGEIASRVIRTARQLDIATVAVFSDADAHAPFVAQADEVVRLPGESAAETYLRSDKLIAAARITGSDAVHPGYGFLSERADFARACAEAELVFIGPPAEAIDAMGSKIAAKELMAAAGVPVLPSITVHDGTELGDDLGSRAAREVGFPLLVKAVFGGGGRGMRVVEDPQDLAQAIESARREAEAAFGNGSVFLEHYVETPRHIEVQIFADQHGNVVHLFERECSIQRRYQKIIEESPSPVVDQDLRTSLGQAAIAAGQAIGYVGAGTVEFVLDSDHHFFFLEVNTRLQVEHPVTEMVTGLDLVRLQLLVAEGHPLPSEVLHASLSGHAVEARLYAEDVAAGFLPATGTVQRFRVPDLPGIRVDAGVADGSIVGVHYDPLLAKVIAHGPTRDDAGRRLAAALDGMELNGVTTNRELLIGILRDADFVDGNFDTGYLARHDLGQLSRSRQHPQATSLHVLAAALSGQAERRAAAPVLATLPSGWRNVVNGSQIARFTADGDSVDVSYHFRRGSPQLVDASVGSVAFDVVLRAADATDVDLEAEGVRRHITVHRVGSTLYVNSALGTSVIVEDLRFPEPGSQHVSGSLVAPMPGTVVAIEVKVGQQVKGGALMVILEAMKMEHRVEAPYDGIVVEVGVTLAQSVDVGTVLAVVEEACEVPA
jgi:acetyl/propionyl-CoA carboxylase alpha subunit